MMKSGATPPKECLGRLESLLRKVKDIVEANSVESLGKYRLQFEVTQPKLLVGGTLKQHQLEALDWMINLGAQSSNGILADDMGLGKTIQAISYMAYLKEEEGINGRHLVVCPKSVVNNWMKEVKKWLPSSRVEMIRHTKNERDHFINHTLKNRKFDILVGTYEGVKSLINRLTRIRWETLIVDQAHKIKNYESENFAAMSQYEANFKLLLTGTPLSNNLLELWTLLTFIMPDVFDDGELFETIEESVEAFEGSEEQKFEYQKKIASTFHGIIAPFFKRRTKKQLELGLPAKIEKTIYVSLSEMQLRMYRNFLKYGNPTGRVQSDRYRHPMNARKICLHPYLFEEMIPEEDDTYDAFIENCGKLQVLDKLLRKLIGEGHKVLLFSQFTMMLDLIEDYCDQQGYKYARIDGSTSLEQRQRQMVQFNDKEVRHYDLFLLSTRAGGLGVNLIGADRVIIYDIDWNPQNDIQAMDRAYRIGQDKPVHVFKMVTEHTIEQRMLDFQKYKLIWDELVIQKGMFSRNKKDDPLANLNQQAMVNIGKGEIFKLEAAQDDRTIEEILAIGQEKDQKKYQEMRERLIENLRRTDSESFNPFDEKANEEAEKLIQQYEETMVRRRNYDHERREREKFDRKVDIPPFKFYNKIHQIRQIYFEIYMENKRQPQHQDPKLLAKLQETLSELKNQSKFQIWSEKQFDLFIDAHGMYLSKEYEGIAEFIKTKTPDQVREYSENFFQRAVNHQTLSRIYSAIQKMQQAVKKFRKENMKEGQQPMQQVIRLHETQQNVSQEGRQQEVMYKPALQIRKEAVAEKKQQREAKKKRQVEQKEEKRRKREQELADKRAEKEAEKQRRAQKREEDKKQREIRYEEERKRKEERIEEQKKKAEERVKERERTREEALRKKEQREKELKRKAEEKELSKLKVAEEKRQRELQKLEKDIGKATLEILKKVERESGGSKKSTPSNTTLPKKVEDEPDTCEMGPSDSVLEIVTVAQPRA